MAETATKPEAPKTMKVKLNSSRAGDVFDKDGRQIGNFVQAAGAEVDMPIEEARRHLARGLASEITTKGNPNKD